MVAPTLGPMLHPAHLVTSRPPKKAQKIDYSTKPSENSVLVPRLESTITEVVGERGRQLS